MSQTKISLDTKNKIMVIIKEKIPKEVSADWIGDMTIAELGIDSMTLLQMSFELETDFNLKINLDGLTSSTSINQLVDELESMDD
jgi:acyl carrier protein